jgi:hypothetical protein
MQTTLPLHVSTRRPQGRSRRWVPALAQLASVVAALGAYLAVRFLTQGDRERALAHGADLLGFEKRLGIDVERGVQSVTARVEVVRDACTLLYAWGYWPVVVGTLVVLWRRRRDLYVLYRNALFVSGAVGLAVFAGYPAAPPRMLSGFTDTVAESGHHFVAHPSGFTNPYAALPSFHAGWFFLAAVVLARSAPGRRVRAGLRMAAPLMSAAVVVTANHYVLDVALGVGLSYAALHVVQRRRAHDSGVPAPAIHAAWADASSGCCSDARAASTRAA